MNNFEVLVEKTEELIIDAYLNNRDERPWAIAWSGGKDSSALLSLIINAIHRVPKEHRLRDVHVVMSDTMVENPVLESYIMEQTQLLDEYIGKWDLPLKVHLVHRKPEDSYFVLTIGRGYFLPLNNGGVDGAPTDSNCGRRTKRTRVSIPL